VNKKTKNKLDLAAGNLSKPLPLIDSRGFSIKTVFNIAVIGLLAGVVFIFFSHAATVAGDINNDGTINITDLSLVLSSYGQNTTVCATNNSFTCDLSSPGDGVVNIFDLSILLSNYGKSSTQPPAPPPPPPPVATSCTKTLAAGGSVQTFVNSLSTGDVGCLHGGSYSSNFSITNSGFTLTSYPGETATINASSQIELSGSNLTISKLKIVGSSGLTIRVYGDNIVINGNDITNNHNGMSCIIVGGSTIMTHNLTVTGNTIHGCGGAGSTLDHGIYASHFIGMTVTDNLFYNNSGYSIQLYPEATGAIVTHNVIDGGPPSTRGGIVVDASPTSDNHDIERNIIAYTVSGGIVDKSGTGNQANYNCFFSNSSGNIGGGGSISQIGNITADPMFVNRAAGNYRLGTNSPCLSVVQYDTAAKIGF
jgi:hypothetical protein